MPESSPAADAVEVPHGRLNPLADQVFVAVLAAMRDSLGARWGDTGGRLPHLARLVRSAVQEMDGVHIAADLDHDHHHGVRVQLWVDRDDLDVSLADDVVHEILRELGDREILAVCRSFDDDGIYYRFVSGSVTAALVGVIVLVGPYARHVSRLAMIERGQPIGFCA